MLGMNAFLRARTSSGILCLISLSLTGNCGLRPTALLCCIVVTPFLLSFHGAQTPMVIDEILQFAVQ